MALDPAVVQELRKTDIPRNMALVLRECQEIKLRQHQRVVHSVQAEPALKVIPKPKARTAKN